MSEELLGRILPYALAVIFVAGIVFLLVKGLSKSNVSCIYGATAEMYNTEKKAAMEIIVEQKAKKNEWTREWGVELKNL